MQTVLDIIRHYSGAGKEDKGMKNTKQRHKKNKWHKQNKPLKKNELIGFREDHHCDKQGELDSVHRISFETSNSPWSAQRQSDNMYEEDDEFISHIAFCPFCGEKLD